jgi:hypothetical protein
MFIKIELSNGGTLYVNLARVIDVEIMGSMAQIRYTDDLQFDFDTASEVAQLCAALDGLSINAGAPSEAVKPLNDQAVTDRIIEIQMRAADRNGAPMWTFKTAAHRTGNIYAVDSYRLLALAGYKEVLDRMRVGQVWTGVLDPIRVTLTRDEQFWEIASVEPRPMCAAPDPLPDDEDESSAPLAPAAPNMPAPVVTDKAAAAHVADVAGASGALDGEAAS